MSYGYLTIPLNTNEPYQKIPLDKPSEFILPVFSNKMVVGNGFWFEAVCSTNCTVKVDVAIMASLPWEMSEAIAKGWPIIKESDIWEPCPDLTNFSLTGGTIYRKKVDECIKPYRHMRFTITPSTPTDEKAKRLSYAALRMELSII